MNLKDESVMCNLSQGIREDANLGADKKRQGMNYGNF